jgi:hypothetical protein
MSVTRWRRKPLDRTKWASVMKTAKAKQPKLNIQSQTFKAKRIGLKKSNNKKKNNNNKNQKKKKEEEGNEIASLGHFLNRIL